MPIRARTSVLPILMAGMTVSAVVAAEGGAEAEATIVVTATRTDRSVRDLPVAGSVVDRERIELSPAVNIDDVLRFEPAVDMKRVLGPAAAIPANFSLRGVPGPNRALLLIDGIPTNGAGTGFTSFNAVPLAAVRRVEVVRGPFSGLYGANAFGGVVNVITEDGEEALAGSLRVGRGDEGYGRASATAGGPIGDWRLHASAGHVRMDNYRFRDEELDRDPVFTPPGPMGSFQGWRETDEAVENRDYEDINARLKATWRPTPERELVLQARFFDRDTGIGVSDMLTSEREAVSEDTRVTLGASWRMALREELDWRCSAYWRHGEDVLTHQTQYVEPAATPPFFQTTAYAQTEAESSVDEYHAQTQADWRVGADHALSVGVDLLHNAADFDHIVDIDTGEPIPGSASADESLTTIGIYVQDEILVGEDITVIPALRYDHNSAFDGFLSPRLAASWRARDVLTLRASVGRAFRAPMLSELYKPDWSQTSSVKLRPNPDLDPETIWAGDLGAEYRPTDAMTLGIDIFHNEMDDLIATQVDETVMTNAGPIFINNYVNIDEASSTGGTATVSWRPSCDLNVNASYTFQDTESGDADEELDHLPRHKAVVHLQAGRSWGDWRVEGGLSEAWVGERSYQPYGPPGTPRYELDDYFRTDVHARVVWREDYWLGASAQNLFDADYEESGGTYATGRMLLIEGGVSW